MCNILLMYTAALGTRAADFKTYTVFESQIYASIHIRASDE